MGQNKKVRPPEEFVWCQVGDLYMQRGMDDMPVFDVAWYAAGQMPSYVKMNGNELPGVESIEIKGVVGRPLKVTITFVAGKFNLVEEEGNDGNANVPDG